jgi:hypothetical protein
MEGRCRVALLSRNSRTVVSPDRAPIPTQLGCDCDWCPRPKILRSAGCSIAQRCREVVRCKAVERALHGRMARAAGEGMLAAPHPGGQRAACWGRVGAGSEWRTVGELERISVVVVRGAGLQRLSKFNCLGCISAHGQPCGDYGVDPAPHPCQPECLSAT